MAKKDTETAKPTARKVVITPPKFEWAVVAIEGVAPYMQLRFSEKARKKMQGIQEAGSTGRSKRGPREARNFEDDYEQAKHVSEEGWIGIPAAAFRNASISACRTVGFKMTIAKLSVFIEPDGFDLLDGQPLVRIEGEPEMNIMPVRNATGVADLRARPLWRRWTAEVCVRWDADQFTLEDMANLMARVGLQVGIGEGRPDSKNSAGLGFGMFRVVGIRLAADGSRAVA